MRVVRFCLITCCVLMLASCGLKPTWDAVGKWERADGKETIEFLRNGTVQVTTATSSVTVPYKFVDPKHLQLELGSLGPVVREVLVSGKSLSIVGPEGQIIMFYKAK